jgi:hypothetical protein
VVAYEPAGYSNAQLVREEMQERKRIPNSENPITVNN